MNIGKEKCETLKRIRKEIAEKYELDYIPSECTNEEDCSGTYPKCEEEARILQEQLDDKGIMELSPVDIDIEPSYEESNSFPDRLEGSIIARPEHVEIQIEETSLFSYEEKNRVLYKECKIAGISFHDLKDTWNKLYKGAKLALIRDKENKHDKYAIAVALADDYDGNPDNFDFDCILGYVPRTENQHIATMMDLGWEDAFECELSQVIGSNPFKGSLSMKIYMVSREKKKVEDTSNLIRVLKFDYDEYQNFINDLRTNGYCYFRYGGYPPWEHNLPKKDERVIFMHQDKETTSLYEMHCIAVGDEEASYFVKDKETLFATDDCCYYVFTNTLGPIHIENNELYFLESENINTTQPEKFLSKQASRQMQITLIKHIFNLFR